jgi:hypothetical protein
MMLFRFKLYRANPENKKLARIRFLVFNPATLEKTSAPDLPETGKLEAEESSDAAEENGPPTAGAPA